MEFLVIVFLALLNGVLAMAELAIVSAKKARLASSAEAGSQSAAQALSLQADPEIFLPTVQVGITLVGTISAAFGGSTLAAPVGALLAQWEPLKPFATQLAFVLVVGIISYINLVLGELVPKRLALHFPEKMATLVAPLLVWLAKLTKPVVWVLGVSSNVVLRLLGVKASSESSVTEEDFHHLLAESTRAGVFESREESLVQRVLSLDDRAVSKIMRPRSDVVWLDLSGSPTDNLEKIRTSHHSKYPVCRGSLDQVLGTVAVRDLLVHTTAESDELKGVTDEVHPPLLIPEHLSSLALLERFQTSGQHVGLVVDEYGTVTGLVTVNDILRAIVGDLPTLGVQVDQNILEREDGSLLVDGATVVDVLFAQVELDMPGDAKYHTVAGFVIEQLGHIPQEGDHFTYQGWKFEVMDMDAHRVDKILLSRDAAGSETTES